MQDVPAPKVYLVAKTGLTDGLQQYLDDLEVRQGEWFADPRVSDAENLIEAAGRLCYRSWAPWDPNRPNATNRNVTKVREGNNKYLANIIRQGHGAVLEHATATFVFRDVSRVVTHELVRHRSGMAYSQESLRYVRLTDIRFWLPKSLQDNAEVQTLFRSTVEGLEKTQELLANLFDINSSENFHAKKQLTSMFRRLAPLGLATTIMATGNLRAWRHIVALRTDTAAEEEIRLVFDSVASILKKEFPHAFFDMERKDDSTWTFENDKV